MKGKILIGILISMFLLVSCGNEKDDATLKREEQVAKQQEKENKRKAEIAKQKEDLPEVIEIKEKMFLTQFNDIYMNLDLYENETIKLEGVYCKGAPIAGSSGTVFDATDQNAVDEQISKPLSEWDVMEGTENDSFVYRKTPGCCGADGLAGFEFKYDGEKPKPNSWIEVEGKLIRENNGNVFLQAKNVKVLEKRGEEFVSQ